MYKRQVHVFGEITTTAYVPIPKIIRDTIREIGYTDAHYGFDAAVSYTHLDVYKRQGESYVSIEELAHADCILSVGGDGSFLGAARTFSAGWGIPLYRPLSCSI